MRDDFERVMRVACDDGASVWDRLKDVELLVSCSSSVSDVAELDAGQRWSVNLRRTVGRFGMRAPVIISIRSEVPGEQIVVRFEGSDNKLGTRLNVDATMAMAVTDSGVTLTMAGTYEVTGRIASLGSGVVRKHATQMIDEFAANLPEALRTGQPVAGS